MSEPELHFEVHPSVVFRLGEELISDGVQAVLELLKNSYDADAGWVRLEIFTKESLSGSQDELVGRLSISDNGTGMTLSDIRRGWLRVAASPKVDARRKGIKTTRYKRTPLGEKGLGRLGAQRLGDLVKIQTWPLPSNGSKVATGRSITVDWRDFRTYEVLNEVPIETAKLRARSSGTTIEIWGLRHEDDWEDSGRLRLQQELSKLISPAAPPKAFSVHVSINGDPLHFAQLTERIRDSAQVRWAITFDGERMLVEGDMALAFLRPNSKKQLPEYEFLVGDDNGRAFLQGLRNSKRAKSLGLKQPRRKRYFVSFAKEFLLSERPWDQLGIIDGKVVSPGPFSASIDGFSLDPLSLEEQQVFSEAAEYKQFMKDLAGIRVYRDGFGIRLDEDWLGLTRAFRSGTSYYQIKPSNVLGFVNISAGENSGLVETTDREGFVLSPSFASFKSCLLGAIEHINDCQDLMARAYNQFRKESTKSRANVPSNLGPMELSAMVGETLKATAELNDQVTASRRAITSALKDKSSAVDALEFANDTLRKVETAALELVALRDRAYLLEGEVSEILSRLDQLAEMVGVGLTAESLSHELTNVVRRLNDAATRVRRTLRAREKVDPVTLTFVEEVQTAIRALRKQLSYLNPMLRYVREHRALVEVESTLKALADYHSDRWSKKSLALEIAGDCTFSVMMNRGKLLQILDNFILNSEYWLEDARKKGQIERGFLTIKCASPSILLWDNGPGVDPAVEERLFDPFVTRKGKGFGRGLGLYIVRQLLAAEGCTVSLQQKRNSFGRRYVFEIDCAGALTEE